jgi:hypothetical protein
MAAEGWAVGLTGQEADTSSPGVLGFSETWKLKAEILGKTGD